MKQSLVLVGGLLAVFATAAQAQKSHPQKQSPATQVKRAFQPSAIQAPPAAPLVGGTDSCVTPDPIAGTGSFTFDNTLATTGVEGQAEAQCLLFGLNPILQDVWFVWTAPSTGVAVLETCNITAIDTKIAAYAGTTCPVTGSALACNDDGCSIGYQSHVQFGVTSGNSYVIQIGLYPGTFPTATPGVGQFSLTISNTPINDDCTTPTTVTGLGIFPFDNSSATTGAQGQAEAICNYFGGTAINNDLWYTWVAPSTGSFGVTTEGLTDVDTKISVYDGAGCPAAASIGCNDDGNNNDLESLTTFNAVAGNSYTIQLGLYQGTTFGGTGEFAILSTTPRPEDNCATPAALAGQGTFVVDNVFTSTGAEGQTEVACTFFASTSIEVDSWYLWTPDASGTATVTMCPGSFADNKLAVYNGPACPTAGTALACNDDFCGATGLQSEVSFSAVCGQTYLIQLGSYPGGGLTNGYMSRMDISIAGSPCATPSTAFCDGSAVGTTCLACGNNGGAGRGCANSSFATGGLLVNGGISSVSADTMTLTASSVTGPGLFFQANGLAGSPITFGDGMLCAAAGIIRLGVVFPTAGSATYPGGLTPNPIHIGGAPIAAGNTKHYQCWYRDAVVFCSASTFNLTNGVSLTWVP